jgi:metal-sulfur cluster biosynthetic enzyme/ribosomal protein L22
MGPVLTAKLYVEEPQLRVTENDARAALDAVTGRPAIAARARLRFGPGRTCEPIARLLDRAIMQAERAGLDPERLIVTAGHARAAEDIVRVRRKAHGKADWIHSATSRVQLTLQPAGLYAAARTDERQSAGGPEPAALDGHAAPPPAAPDPADGLAAAVHQALFEVIDPDLGVNIVDLGFVRGVTVEGRTAVITMTLTSAACPLTSIMEDQIRAGLAALTEIGDLRVDWQWLPAWRPEDISVSGREQLRAVGFTI